MFSLNVLKTLCLQEFCKPVPVFTKLFRFRNKFRLKFQNE